MAKIIKVEKPKVSLVATETSARQNWMRFDNGKCVTWFKRTKSGFSTPAKSTQVEMEALFAASNLNP